MNFEAIDRLDIREKNPLCIECGKHRVHKFRKSNELETIRYKGKDGLCIRCSIPSKERAGSQSRALTCQKGSVIREKRFKPLFHVGLKLRGRKFEQWANSYCKENL